MPTLAVCSVLNVPDRQAFVQRESVMWAHERGKHSLSDMNGKIPEVGDKVAGRRGGRALRKGVSKISKEKELASTSVQRPSV